MSICASGASEPKVGVPLTIVVGTAFLVSILAPELLWLEPYISASASTLNFYLPDFCSVDPPADPGLSGTDLVAVVLLGDSNPDHGPMDRLRTLVAMGVWNALCQCTSGGPPTITLPSVPPTGSPAINPPSVVSGNPGGVCLEIDANGLTLPSNNGAFMSQWETGALITPTSTAQQTAHNHDRTIPAGAKSVTVTATVVSQGVGPRTIDWGWVWRSATFANVAGGPTTASLTGNGMMIATQLVPAGAVYFYAYLIQSLTGAAPTQTVNMKAQFYCDALPGQSTSPCCPPDPIATGLLVQILNMVTLTQRQLAPFSSIHGDAHTGITGNGQFSVQGLLGVAIDITTLPSRAGLVAGNPDTLWDVGWLRVGTADGWGPRVFITADPFVLTPVSGDTTIVGYSIPDDVTVTITEIVREA